jgi:hypothetical protein
MLLGTKLVKNHFPIITYIFLVSRQDSLLWGILSINLLSLILSKLLSSIALVEQPEFYLSFMAGEARIIIITSIIIVPHTFRAKPFQYVLSRAEIAT